MAEPFYQWLTTSIGRVLVYKRGSKESSHWNLITTIEGKNNAWLGDSIPARESLALDREGTIIAVSSVDFSQERGYVEVWSLNETDPLPAILPAAYRLLHDRHNDKRSFYGNSIAMSASGNCVVAGAFRYDNGFAANKDWGQVRQLLRDSSTGRYDLHASKTANNKQTRFGTSVSVSDNCSYDAVKIDGVRIQRTVRFYLHKSYQRTGRLV